MADPVAEQCTTKAANQIDNQSYELLTQGFPAAIKFLTVVSIATLTDTIVEPWGMNTKLKIREQEPDLSTPDVCNRRKTQPVTTVDKITTITDIIPQQQVQKHRVRRKYLFCGVAILCTTILILAVH